MITWLYKQLTRSFAQTIDVINQWEDTLQQFWLDYM